MTKSIKWSVVHYLCKRKAIVPETTVSSLYLLTVNERIISEDNIMHQVAKEEPISLLTLIEKSGKTLTTPSENALYLPGNSYIEETEDEKVVDLFNELTKDKTGKYTYCSLLGTQVVAGTNYLILSHYISEENVRSYKLLTIYNGVNGTKEIIREEEINVRYLLNNIIVAED